jgi:hypothetical protein
MSIRHDVITPRPDVPPSSETIVVHDQRLLHRPLEALRVEEEGTMKIMLQDGRLMQGTPKQIVQQMRDLATFFEGKSFSEYIDWVVANTLRFEGFELHITGETDDERAQSLVDEMLRTDLARRV